MKNSYRFLSTLIMYMPIIYVALLWDRLPVRVPVHFTEMGQADQFASRPSWLWTLLLMFILLTIFRSSMLSILLKRTALTETRHIMLQLLTAVFVSSIVLLFILQTKESAPLYTDYLPILLSFFAAGALYCTTSKPTIPTLNEVSSAPFNKRTQVLHYLQAVSVLVTIRVNLLAGLIMLFAQSADRWMIGILANLLALASLTFLTYRQLKDVF